MSQSHISSHDYRADLINKLISRTYTQKTRGNLPNSDDLKKEQEIREHTLSNDAKKSTLDLRVRICYWVMALVTVYLLFVGYIIHNIEELSDAVLIALLTTTTINVLGLPLMIILSLFPKGKE